jgi:hypothetical protein
MGSHTVVGALRLDPTRIAAAARPGPFADTSRARAARCAVSSHRRLAFSVSTALKREKRKHKNMYQEAKTKAKHNMGPPRCRLL